MNKAYRAPGTDGLALKSLRISRLPALSQPYVSSPPSSSNRSLGITRAYMSAALGRKQCWQMYIKLETAVLSSSIPSVAVFVSEIKVVCNPLATSTPEKGAITPSEIIIICNQLLRILPQSTQDVAHMLFPERMKDRMMLGKTGLINYARSSPR